MFHADQSQRQLPITINNRHPQRPAERGRIVVELPDSEDQQLAELQTGH